MISLILLPLGDCFVVRSSLRAMTMRLTIAGVMVLGSCSESLTRAIGFFEVNLITRNQFDSFETLHFEVENKLLGLIRSLEKKKKDGKTWVDSIAEEQVEYYKSEIE